MINFPEMHEQTEFFQTTEGQEALQLISHEGFRLVVEKFGFDNIPLEAYEAMGGRLPSYLVTELAKAICAYKTWVYTRARASFYNNNEIVEAREILGVGLAATKAEIKTAWKRLAVKHHPDLGGCTILMQAINAAYELLTK